MLETKKWVDILLKSSPKERKKVKDRVLQGIKYFGAKWKKTSEDNGPEYSLKSLAPKASQLVKELNSSDFEWVGFAPNINYIKGKGTKKQLDVLWDHPFAHPNVVYAHKTLPCIIIAGPNIMLDDSIINKIPANEITEPVGGWTG